MKKIVIDHYSHTFRPLRLYREDLDRVLEILSGRCNEINISDESHVYDSLRGDEVFARAEGASSED
ncbi:MAG: hypothetical protein ACLQOO_37125 [Terriglobia bacterium]